MKLGLSLKDHSASIGIWLRISDLIAVVFSGLTSYWLRFQNFDMVISYKYVLLIGALISITSFSLLGAYKSWRGSSFSSEIKCIISSTIATFLLLIISGFITQSSDLFSRIWIVSWLCISIFIVLFLRLILRRFLGLLRIKGFNTRQVIIVGDGELGQNIAKRLLLNPEQGFHVQGFITTEEACSPLNDDFPILGDINNVNNIIKQYHTDQVWIALPLTKANHMEKVQSALATSPVTIRMVPDIFGFQLLNHSLSEVAGLPLINLSASHMLEGKNRFLKQIEDKVLSLLILIAISPILVIIASAIKLSSNGPVFYKQERVSWNGRTFKMLKFRSMTIDSEKDGVKWGGSSNMQTTKLGKAIRKTSLDELPQFINVLKGDMSIVGPRPERTVFVEQFKQEIPGYMQKHTVKAGITGWAQVNGWRGDTDLKKRIEHDLYYIENWSLWFDLKIIALTFLKGFINKNAN